MRCPRCGYTTAYEFEACPQCETNLESLKIFDMLTASKGGFWIRLAAFVVDNIIIFFATGFFAFVAGLATGLGGLTSDVPAEDVEYLATVFGFFIGILIGPFFFTFFTGWDGQTPGKRLLGLRVVRTTGEPVGYGRALLRYIGYFISFFFLGLGFVMIAVDRNKRGLHDMIAGTCVIKVE
ncbi:MAG: RDD family protein [Nitrospirae bacterium]|nr:RDD family protein [Nitrospirota bacterium]